jgi:1-acyl-sn-glycerol-3-phosphate acyltransferase
MLLTAAQYLKRHCPVMIFPEGTRSPNGSVGRFTDGAFHLAIRAHVPVLPVAIDGSFSCLPKKSWRFGEPSDNRVHILPPIETEGMTLNDVTLLRDRTRDHIVTFLSSPRSVPAAE